MELKDLHPKALCKDCAHRSQMPGEENKVYCKQFFATMPNDGWCCYGKEDKKCNLEI